MKKKLLIAITTLLLCLSLFTVFACDSTTAKELVSNGGFENVDSDTNSVGNWLKKSGSAVVFAANTDSQATEYDVNLGIRYAYLESSSTTFDYLSQTITVKRGTTYRITAYINLVAITTANDVGARVGFLEDTTFIGINVDELTDGYQTFETYFVSAVNGEMTLTVGLGSSSNNVSGTVGFDNISVQAVSSVPSTFEGDVETLKNGQDYSLNNGLSTAFVTLGSIFAIIFLIVLYFILRKASAEPILNNTNLSTDDDKQGGRNIGRILLSPMALFIYTMLALFISRFIMTITSSGMVSNISALESIAVKLANNGMGSIFTDADINQPSGNLYLLWAFGKFAQAVDVTSGSLGYAILLRLPMIIADLITAYIIFNFATKNLGEKSGLAMLALYTFIPVFAIMSGLYASMECVAMAFAVACIISMLEKKHISCGVLFTIGLLFSNYMLLLLPIILTYQVVTMIKNKDAIKVIVPLILACFIVFYLLSIPFCFSELRNGNVFYVFKKMYNFFAQSAFLSTDTFNLYAIFGKVNNGSRNTFIDVFNWIFVIAMVAYGVYIYIKNSNRMDLLLIAAAIFVLYPILGAQATITVLPIGVLLLLLYTCVHQDRRLYWCMGGFSVLSYINIAGLMARSGYITGEANAAYLAFFKTSPFVIIFSILTVLLAGYFIYVIYDITMIGKTSDILPLNKPLKRELQDITTKIKKKFVK